MSAFLLFDGPFVSNGFVRQAQKKTDQKDQPVRLKMDLFELQAVVTDAKGKLVDNLQKEDFELLENNRRQTVDNAQVSFEAHIDGQKLNYTEQSGLFHFDLEVVTTIYDLSGKKVDGFAETVKANLLPARLELLRRNGLNYSKRLALKPGLYQLRVGVRELSNDRIGATTAWVEVPDLSKGKLSLSSIFLRRDLNEKEQKASDIKNAELPNTRTAQGIRAYKQGEFIIHQLMIYNPPPSAQSVFH